MEFVERKIIFHGSNFVNFYLNQPAKFQEKIEFVFHIIKRVERVSKKFLSPMENTDGLFEIRVEYGSNIYRIFCCFDEGRLVVLFNAFQKKTQKTPQKEIEKALRLKREYFELKKTQENEKRSNKKR